MAVHSRVSISKRDSTMETYECSTIRAILNITRGRHKFLITLPTRPHSIKGHKTQRALEGRNLLIGYSMTSRTERDQIIQSICFVRSCKVGKWFNVMNIKRTTQFGLANATGLAFIAISLPSPPCLSLPIAPIEQFSKYPYSPLPIRGSRAPIELTKAPIGAFLRAIMMLQAKSASPNPNRCAAEITYTSLPIPRSHASIILGTGEDVKFHYR